MICEQCKKTFTKPVYHFRADSLEPSPFCSPECMDAYEGVEEERLAEKRAIDLADQMYQNDLQLIASCARVLLDEVLPQTSRIVLDIGNVNDLAMALTRMKDHKLNQRLRKELK